MLAQVDPVPAQVRALLFLREIEGQLRYPTLLDRAEDEPVYRLLLASVTGNRTHDMNVFPATLLCTTSRPISSVGSELTSYERAVIGSIPIWDIPRTFFFPIPPHQPHTHTHTPKMPKLSRKKRGSSHKRARTSKARKRTYRAISHGCSHPRQQSPQPRPHKLQKEKVLLRR